MDKGVHDILIVDALGTTAKWKNLFVGKQYLDVVHKSAFVRELRRRVWSEIEAIFHLGACSATTEQTATIFLKTITVATAADLAEYAEARNIRFIYLAAPPLMARAKPDTATAAQRISSRSICMATETNV